MVVRKACHVVGILLLVSTLFLVLSVSSYSPGDPTGVIGGIGAPFHKPLYLRTEHFLRIAYSRYTFISANLLIFSGAPAAQYRLDRPVGRRAGSGPQLWSLHE